MESGGKLQRLKAAARCVVLPALALAAPLVFASPAAAVTVGPSLNQTPAFGAGCEVVLISNLLPAPPSCSMFDPVTAQTPRGRWRVTSAQVRTGPRTGPMRFTMIQALRSKSGAGGVICCTASSMGPAFTPPANSTTRVPLNLSAVNTTQVIDREQIEVVDYLGITLLSQAGSIAFATSAVPGTTFFAPAFTPGAQRLGGAIPYPVIPMIRGEFRPCGALGSAASVSATACVPRRFAVSSRVRVSGNGTNARVNVAVPAAGTLVVSGAGSAGRLLRRTRSKAGKAGRFRVTAKLNSRGKRKLRSKGRLAVTVKVRFNPRNGKAKAKKIKVKFRR